MFELDIDAQAHQKQQQNLKFATYFVLTIGGGALGLVTGTFLAAAVGGALGAAFA